MQIEKIRASKEPPEKRTIFHEILHSDIPESEKSTPRLVDEAMVLAIAGSDTTASTLVALTYHVLSDRQIFHRLREELESVMPDASQAPDPAKLDKLPFFNALIEEAIRFYPAAPHRQDRVAPDEDLFCHGIKIPAGTMVGMTAPLINRHPGLCDDPNTFNPQRYLDDPTLFRRHLTFSKGARICLGMNLAYQELQTFLAGIFRKYSPYDATLKVQNGPTIEIVETTLEDIQLYSDWINVGYRPGSKGLRVKVRSL